MINKTGKRILKTENGVFYWYIKNDWYSANLVSGNLYGLTLYIISADRKEALHYLIGSNFVTVTAGRIFFGKKFRGWQRFRCPVWSGEIITPGIVKKITDWHMADKKEYIMTDCNGNIINNEKIW